MRTPFAVFRIRRSSWIAVGIVCLLEARASATGFFINQQGVRTLGRVDAGNTVAADELSTIFYNPAALPRIFQEPQTSRIRVSAGAQLIIPRSDQRNRGTVAATPGTLGNFVPLDGGDSHNGTDPTPVPNFYFAMANASGRGAIGIGLNAPFGLAIEFDPGWHGRYDATFAELKTMNASIVGAYHFDSGVSVGGGLDVQRATTKLRGAIPNPLVPGGPTAATDATIETSGDGVTVGFNVGLLYTMAGDMRFGVHYRSPMKHDISGTSEVRNLPAALGPFNGVVDATADINLPAITTIGVGKALSSDWLLLGEFGWFDWSTFEEVRIRFADGRPDAVRPTRYRDAYSYAVGAEYLVDDRWTARGGLHYDTTPTVDAYRDTTVPDAERFWLGLGATLRANDRFELDLAFTHAFFSDTNINLTRTFFDGTPAATSVNIRNDVTTAINTVAVDFRFRF